MKKRFSVANVGKLLLTISSYVIAGFLTLGGDWWALWALLLGMWGTVLCYIDEREVWRGGQ